MDLILEQMMNFENERLKAANQIWCRIAELTLEETFSSYQVRA